MHVGLLSQAKPLHKCTVRAATPNSSVWHRHFDDKQVFITCDISATRSCVCECPQRADMGLHSNGKGGGGGEGPLEGAKRLTAYSTPR